MAVGRIIQNSLNAGEISPNMEGRIDFPRYQNGAQTLENFLIHTQGGVSRRWGTRYYATAKVGATAVRLIPFIFDPDNWYPIEFGVGYIRILRPNGSVGHTAAVDITTALPLYTAAELFEIVYAQSNDVMYIVHPNHPVRKLSRLDSYGDAWEIKDVVFLPPPVFEADVYPATTFAVSALTGSTIRCYAGSAYFLAADVDKEIYYLDARAIITAVDAAGLYVDVDIIDPFPASRIVAGVGTTSGVGVTQTTSAPHGLTAANVGDLMVIATGAAAGEVRRIDGIPGVDTITINAAFSVDPAGGTWNRGVHVDAAAWRTKGSPASKLTTDKVGPVRSIATLTLATAGWRTTDVGRYVRGMGGTAKITSYTSPTIVKAQILSPFSSAPTTAPFETLSGTWTLEDESWTAAYGYPATICFYEQRLFFAGTTQQPQTIWGSATADFENFAFGSLATDAVSYTIASNEVNKVKWMSPSRVLLVGALAREYRASGGSDAITPTNIDIRGETSYGSKKRKPVQIGHTTMFITASGRRVREMLYNFDNDAYKADDLTILNPEISTGGFEELAYSQEPTSLLFAVRSDGQLCVLTYEKSQEVMGWGRWFTDGLIESVCVLPQVASSGRDSIFLVVSRTGGRYIERFDSTLNTDSAVAGTFAPPAKAVTGLSHLNGKTVRMKGDGALYADAVVAGGTVSFPENVTAYEVGLDYVSKVVTPRPELVVGGMTTQGKPKRWSSIMVRVLNTIGLKVNGERQWVRDTQDIMGDAPLPETGFLVADTLEVDRDGRLTIEQDLPFPATVLMVVGELAVGD